MFEYIVENILVGLGLGFIIVVPILTYLIGYVFGIVHEKDRVEKDAASYLKTLDEEDELLTLHRN